MRKTIVMTILLVVGLIGFAPAVSLAERPSHYFMIKGGIYSPSEKFDLNNIEIDSDTGFSGEVAVGHYFMPALALEFGAGYFESRGSPATPPGETKLEVVPVVLTLKALVPVLGPVEPYAEFGVGAYLTQFDASAELDTAGGTTKVSYGLHAGAGVNFDLTERFLLGFEGRYIWSKPDFGGTDVRLDGFTVTGNLGWRF